MQWLPNQDWREAAFTFNWWQMQPSCQKFIRATCKLLIPTSLISLTLNMITKNQTSLHFQLFLCFTSDDSAQFIDSDIVAYKLVCYSVPHTLIVEKTTSRSIFKRHCSFENPNSIIQEIVTMPPDTFVISSHIIDKVGWHSIDRARQFV